MKQLLVVHGSPMRTKSFSRKIAERAVELLQSQNSGLTVIRRDLAAEPAPHLNEAAIVAMRGPAAGQSWDVPVLAHSNRLVDELVAADAVVLSAPMHNFGVSSQLKAYIDNVVRVGRTFRYGENGRPVGLLGGKAALIVVARGGVYSSGPLAALDFQESYLRTILGFIGVNPEFVRVEGTALGGTAAEAALAKAEAALHESRLATDSWNATAAAPPQPAR
ncbi:MAG TPA: NAD(P)H-dependent oxidoreductase [Steroidobacteraceae bacterium]|nr:NAD(P)H-dependent oxidoreductase [Steroidobacteraceae bacterium]